MISTADFKVGLTIELDGKVYQITYFQHVKPGKGGAFVRTRLRELRTGRVFEKTFRAGERMEAAHVDRREMQFLYHTGDEYYVMDLETYDQVALTPEQIGEARAYLKDGQEIQVALYEGKVIGVELPGSVELRVTQAEPGVRGDTVQGGRKPARVESGATVQVPLFISVGDMIKVDTRSGQYIDRVK